MASAHQGKAISQQPKALSAGTDTKQFTPPRLRAFRSLQRFALLAAFTWLGCSSYISYYVTEQQLERSLLRSKQHVDGEVDHLIKALAQNMFQAEQLSKTLSFDQSIIKLAQESKNHSSHYEQLDPAQRTDYILQLPSAAPVNRLFEQLAQHVDLNQILLMDHKGYCVGSSRYDQPNGCIGVRYHTRKYFNQALLNGSGRQFAIGRVFPTPSFFFSTAIKKDGETFGAVVVRQKMQQIVGFLNHQKELTLLTGADGIILSSSQPELIYQYIGTDFAPPLDISAFQRTYHLEKVTTLALTKADIQPLGYPLMAFAGQIYLYGQSTLDQGDFHIYIFENVEPQLAQYRNTWTLAITIIILGLLLIVLLERNVNFSQHRLAHMEALSEANDNLVEMTQTLYQLTVTDPLTGISNRRFFNSRLTDEISRAKRNASSDLLNCNATQQLALMIIDIDLFKQVNDAYGHPAGDQAIRAMAQLCTEAVRQYDFVARIGGEEFAILLTDISSRKVRTIAERIRSQCETTTIKYNDLSFSQTCSIGIAFFATNDTADLLLSRADKALYLAKHEGRNRVVAITNTVS